MLRATYVCSAMILLFSISASPTNYLARSSGQSTPAVANWHSAAPGAVFLPEPVLPALTRPSSPLADGSGPMPPPIPLAQPAPVLADGSGTMPPPIPLAQPALVLADGSGPMPPPNPLAQPALVLADGSGPMPPPIPLAIPAGTSVVRLA